MNFDLYSEKLDAYLKAQLPAEEKALFEQMLAQDPVLRSDFALQQDIYESLCNYRKAELKQRFEQIKIEEVPFYYSIPRTTVWGTLALAGVLISMLVMWDIEPTEQPTNTAKTNTQQSAPQITPAYRQPETSTEIPTQSSSLEANAMAHKPALVPDKKTTAIPTNMQGASNTYQHLYTRKTSVATQEAPPTHESTDDRSPRLSIASVDKKTIAPAFTRNTDTDLGVFDGKQESQSLEHIAERNKLAYQYYNNKLFLYNQSSQGKEIHKMIEGVKRYFVCLDEEFYEFNDRQFTKAELKPITDIKLIQELKKELER